MFLEKFALLNLLKAIDGLKSLSAVEKEAPSAAAPTQQPTPQQAPQTTQTVDLPNIMYEALVRHEIVSNRIRNRK